jgi:hypothetical protein
LLIHNDILGLYLSDALVDVSVLSGYGNIHCGQQAAMYFVGSVAAIMWCNALTFYLCFWSDQFDDTTTEFDIQPHSQAPRL